MSTEPGLKPAYLIVGTDGAKIDAALGRLRSRAEREGGPGALEAFAPADGQGPPDVEALLAAFPAMSLMATRRYLLADGVERWSAQQGARVAEALAALPPETTVVLVARIDPAWTARERNQRRRLVRGLEKGVEGAGGEVVTYEAPSARELPAQLVAGARRRGFHLDPAGARLLVERMGEGTVRLVNELDRLALWAGEGGKVGAEDLAAMVADTSEEAAWALSDAIISRDAGAALRVAERLTAQGGATTPLVYQAAKRLREAHDALAGLEAGLPQKEVESSLGMHPYAAKMLIRRVRGASIDEVRSATCAIADLEWWTRGGADYPEAVALTIAVRRAAGAGEC